LTLTTTEMNATETCIPEGKRAVVVVRLWLC
jgi:hypothetical protein